MTQYQVTVDDEVVPHVLQRDDLAHSLGQGHPEFGIFDEHALYAALTYAHRPIMPHAARGHSAQSVGHSRSALTSKSGTGRASASAAVVAGPFCSMSSISHSISKISRR
jgi:hypothetical protein